MRLGGYLREHRASMSWVLVCELLRCDYRGGHSVSLTSFRCMVSSKDSPGCHYGGLAFAEQRDAVFLDASVCLLWATGNSRVAKVLEACGCMSEAEHTSIHSNR